MIHVRFDRNEDGTIHTFTMDGHADAAPHGQDLVCAGASAISFGSINAIAAICDVRLDVSMEDDGGFLRCRVPENLDSDTYEKVQILLEGMFYSLKTMEEQYGQYIRIEQ
ncbi:ribosomal-processing cysteine protease Prp [Bacillus shivajii]|uniref:ribosomal-processing cysteine protease Prp n=1 Tax=Bacillus shivajii TaxID=1983719 RepID=UPI001CF9F496|nr:ribosomal-processing cysteine protease Prp [Bacillus shivajii]UCZ52080.1 ribosomal-processing cysteine protease Prp [Bacillus shivajii]